MTQNDDGESSNLSSTSLRNLFLRKFSNFTNNNDDQENDDEGSDFAEIAKEAAENSSSRTSTTKSDSSTTSSSYSWPNYSSLFLFGRRDRDELKKWFHDKFGGQQQNRNSSSKSEREDELFPVENGNTEKTENRDEKDDGNLCSTTTNCKTQQPESSSRFFNKMLETCINFEPGMLEIEEHSLFEKDQAVWILGDSYNTMHDREQIKQALRSILWFTYRKNFAAIGGTGPTSDQGWGCMLRCGQMLLAQALIRRHLGSWWRWDPLGAKDQQYTIILRMFQDKKNQMYSIHQIAQMGVSEGKLIGEWFGPNTVAHVLKKLAVYDDWSSLAIHVAMDSVVVREHVRVVCQTRPRHVRTCSSSSGGAAGGYHHVDVGETTGGVCQPSSAAQAAAGPSTKEAAETDQNELTSGDTGLTWRPLLLIVPLRLGLANLNPVYIPALKEFFMLKQCLGAIGGRPNHALYFVGAIGEELIYLDPHYCQGAVDLDADDEGEQSSSAADASPSQMDGGGFKDSSFHCPYLLHMPTANIDPSLALAFYCQNENELEDLCACLRKALFKASDPPLFELLDRQPSTWPKFVPYAGEDAPGLQDFAVVDSHFDTDEEFEILD